MAYDSSNNRYESFTMHGTHENDITLVPEYSTSWNQAPESELDNLLFCWGFSQDIVNRFKELNLTLWHIEETYYSPRHHGCAPKGKLYDRIRNVRQKLIKQGLLETNTRIEKLVPSRLTKSVETECSETDSDEDRNIKFWLKYNQKEENWEEIVNKWKVFAAFRKKECSSKSFKEVIDEWPLYKNAKGPYLVCIYLYRVLYGK
ncbi:hypothetical protein FQR65_LT17050 [Abscondita terminalis]|nr:hypothetical protein FQR65_LT17050 [Abscondita terminalis]